MEYEIYANKNDIDSMAALIVELRTRGGSIVKMDFDSKGCAFYSVDFAECKESMQIVGEVE